MQTCGCIGVEYSRLYGSFRMAITFPGHFILHLSCHMSLMYQSVSTCGRHVLLQYRSDALEHSVQWLNTSRIYSVRVAVGSRVNIVNALLLAMPYGRTQCQS
jgi:hypothetical protein